MKILITMERLMMIVENISVIIHDLLIEFLPTSLSLFKDCCHLLMKVL